MHNHLSTPSWILDGFPRTSQQVSDLRHHLEKEQATIDFVFNIRISSDILWDRVKDRWIHPSSGRTYNMQFKPPKCFFFFLFSFFFFLFSFFFFPPPEEFTNSHSMILVPFRDDDTNEPLIQRSDDTFQAIQNRLRLFEERTKPILDKMSDFCHVIDVDSPTSKDGYAFVKKQLDDYIRQYDLKEFDLFYV